MIAVVGQRVVISLDDMGEHANGGRENEVDQMTGWPGVKQTASVLHGQSSFIRVPSEAANDNHTSHVGWRKSDHAVRPSGLDVAVVGETLARRGA